MRISIFGFDPRLAYQPSKDLSRVIEWIHAPCRLINWTGAASCGLLARMKTNQNPILVKFNPLARLALQLGGLLAAGLLWSGCQRQTPAPPTGGDRAGVYALVSVNGRAVPSSVTHDGTALLVRSGSFTLNEDGTCSTKTVFVPPSGQETTREVSATYTQDGASLTMQWQGAGRTTGTVEGNTFTMNNEGMVFVYKKSRRVNGGHQR